MKFGGLEEKAETNSIAINQKLGRVWSYITTRRTTHTNYIHPRNQNLKYRIAIIMNERRIKNDL